MSFGASPSDIIIVVTFCRALYRKCRSAGGEYDEISREVRGLHTVLKHLKYEVEAPESPLNRDHSLWGRQLAPIIGDCDFTLRQLDELLQKYGRLGSGGSSPSSPSSVRILWERMKFGTNEMDTLGEIRVKMISHKTSLTLFLDTIQLHQAGKMSKVLDNHQNHLDVILDKVDNIAARMGQREGSIMTSYDDDDKEVWKQFRRELVAEGFSSDVLQQHKDVLRAYIREIDQNGLLEEPRTPTPPILSSEQWVDSVHSATSEDAPPSFSSLSTATDSGTKEMMVREDNMKYPQSMKLELRQPESHGIGLVVSQPKPDVPVAERSRDANNSQVGPISIPTSTQLVPSDEKEVIYQNTDGSSSEDESGHDSSSNSAIIRTSDLMVLTRALQLHVPGSSPSASFRSSLGSVADDETLRSMAFRSKKQVELGSSPSQLGETSILPNTLRPSRNSFGKGSLPDDMYKLAPDQHGNEIPPNAMWTKINRSLVSPEVLQQDGRRYEARPDFVAILGVLSRAEIEALAARSQALRASRHRRRLPSQTEKEVPPPQPPRPTPVQQPSFSFDYASHAQDGREMSSSSSYSPSSESESDSDYEHRGKKKDGHRRTPGSKPIPVDGNLNSYAARPPPMLNPRSPNSTAQQAMYMSGGLGASDIHQPIGQPQSWSYNYNPPHQKQQRSNNAVDMPPQAGSWRPPPLNPHPSQQYTQQYPVRSDRESDRERIDRDRDRDTKRVERERGQRRRHSSKHNGNREHSDYSRYSYAPQNPRQGKHSRWKENLASAGIGGAAATLLNVLTEAAEAL